MTSGFNYQEELSKCSTMEDITGPNGLVQRMVKDAIEPILQSEITDYITDEKNKGNTPNNKIILAQVVVEWKRKQLNIYPQFLKIGSVQL